MKHITLGLIAFATLIVALQQTSAAFALSTITVTPLTDSHPVGTSHTIQAVVFTNQTRATSILVHFDILSGPDAGLVSSSSGTCSPANCTLLSTSGTVKWTFNNNGSPGTDVIEVCATNIGNDIVPDITCSDDVTVDWFEPARRVGALPAAILPAGADTAAKNRARAAGTGAAPVTAPAVSPPATGTGISVSPPNTGDAGLKHSSDSTKPLLALALAAGAMAGFAGYRLARR